MKQHPNIIYVFADAYRQQAVGCMNADPVATPNLDGFAEQSVKLSHCVSTQPICSPYRGMLMSGLYPHRSGVGRNCNSGRPDSYLRPETRCWSDVMAERGYSLGYIGKWHLDYPDDQPHEWLGNREPKARQWDAFTPPGPQRHGFGFWYAYGAYNNHLQPHYWTGDGGIESRIDVEQWAVEHETDVAIRFLRNEGGACRDDDKPFALAVSYNPPHGPHDLVPEKYRAMYRDKPVEELLNRPNVDLSTEQGARAGRCAADYFAACTGVDDQFGRLLAEIDALGLGDETIVIFTSDHGEMLGSHGRMLKSVWYDESMLVPFMMRAPGAATPRWDDLLLSPPDLCPTLLGLAGLGEHVPDGVQGVDRSAVLLTGEGERPELALYRNPGPEDGPPEYRGLRTHRYTFVTQHPDAPAGPEAPDDQPRRLLYDSEADPYQMSNIADREPALVAEFEQRLWAELDAIGDPWAAADRPGGSGGRGDLG